MKTGWGHSWVVKSVLLKCLLNLKYSEVIKSHSYFGIENRQKLTRYSSMTPNLHSFRPVVRHLNTMWPNLSRHPCRGPKWWKPCCCAMRGSLQQCPGNFPASGGTSRSRAPGGNCRTPRTPAFLASPPCPLWACRRPERSASTGAPDPANTHRPDSRSLAVGRKTRSITLCLYFKFGLAKTVSSYSNCNPAKHLWYGRFALEMQGWCSNTA